MFSVRVDILFQAYDQLRRSYRRMSDAQEDMRKSKDRLTVISDMQGIIARLDKQEQYIQAQMLCAGQMLRALEHSLDAYTRAETNISNECDAILLTNKRYAWGYTNLERVRGLMGDIHID